MLLFSSLLVLGVNFVLISAQTDGSIDITDPCRYPVSVGVEKHYIPDENMWASTIADLGRGPHYARLNGWYGGGSWTAGTPNFHQYLGIDLGYRQVITGVVTQGRRGSGEFVTEYYLEYSSDNKTWSVYTNKFGTPLMFEANIDDNSHARNDLDYTIVARYIRFNPQRWHKFISMRVEAYGCKFDGESATFDSHSSITYDISGEGQFVQTRKDHLKMRFQTNEADGLILYADGNQGDHFVLEMIRGRLYFHINLGTTTTSNGETTFRAGSLLDDNQWHDVEINRSGREVNLTVDRLTITNMTNGDFYQLDLDRKVRLGGIDNFLQPGKVLMSRKNFTGCMENVWFNYMDIIKDTRMNQPRFELDGSVLLGMCQADTVIPYTFPTLDSHMELTSAPGQNRLRIGFHFRSYNKGGLLFVHDLAPSGKVTMKLSDGGYIQYTIQTSGEPDVQNIITNRDQHSDSDVFTDGWWHNVDVDIESGANDRVGVITITVDGHPDISNRQLQFTTTETFYIGGGDQTGGETGFLGCMRNIQVQGEYLQEMNKNENNGVINGTCSVQDRCDPNPCEHGGICSQDFTSFTCDCTHTGYEGAVCHKSKYMVSCEEARMLNPTLKDMETWIDIDDSGPLKPFPTKCVFDNDNDIAWTEVSHFHADQDVEVDGYQSAGSYIRPILYDTERENFDEIIERSSECEQYISWMCQDAKLLTHSGSSDPNEPSWGWWVGRTNLNMRYWGGSSPGSGMCKCALQNECIQSDKPCNCDAGLTKDIHVDDGFLNHKEHLPVMELRFGDTGSIGDHKKGFWSLGPLRCAGDTLFDNIVTFRKADATIEFPTFDAATSGDIRFQFRTTQLDGVFLQNTGNYHFIEVKLVFGNSIHFRFDVGNGIQTLEQTTAYPMNDDQWHTVHVERNRKQAILKVDQQASVTLDEPIDQGFRTLDLTSNLVIGAAVDYRDGYVGCMRGLMVNGVEMDLRGKVERGEVTYGVSSGCHPKCASNPCFNEGICIEWYSHYVCDCAYTPYRGWDCGREVGVNMQPDYMIKYTFDQASGDISTDEETIIIGFSTQEKKGLLMLIRNDDDEPEYISVEMNNNGGVKVALDVGFERDEANTNIQDVDLANEQQHVVVVKRTDRGRVMTIYVDDYPPTVKSWDLPDSADTKLDRPKYIYFGRNETTRPGDGFKGCLYRAQFDNLYPFKRVFQDPRPDYLELTPEEDIRESMCGFEEVTHEPEPAEFRPTPATMFNETTPAPEGYGESDGLTTADTILYVAVGIVVFVLLVLLILLLIYLIRGQDKGDYHTFEAKDAEYFDSPDTAVSTDASNQPQVKKKDEYFI